MLPLLYPRNHFLEPFGEKAKRNLMYWRNSWCCYILSLLQFPK
ncbi:hypothetical protein PORCRE_1644 [Porphyromonas crevioricanis JCM 15906]|uniref:Uncharacterized protein n=1 Tax=Porphyromonas crevioricanis JCM 15906 TaxID=1305617 RepID=T1DTP9_9PORP|nr:hypothetical protein PORCRE_1644 [Porphyromonas crevioricanis JCM 15906]